MSARVVNKAGQVYKQKKKAGQVKEYQGDIEYE
jgi:hypothetical protein